MPLLTEANGGFVAEREPTTALAPVGVADPTPEPIVSFGPNSIMGGMGGMMGGRGGGGGPAPFPPEVDPVLPVDPVVDPVDPIDPNTGTGVDPGDPAGGDPLADVGEGSRPGAGDDVSVQDLYPDAPEGQEMGDVDVADVEGADVVEADLDVGTVDAEEASTETEAIVDDAAATIADIVGGGEETALTAEAMVDAELARILGQDSPLLQQARAEAARFANARGLQNSSMAAGMSYDAMVKAALPMAQQNAQQALEREMANTANRQEANIFTADQMAQLAELEATLGHELSVFNVDQLNKAAALTAEMQTALEQGNQQAYNDAALQLAELERDAQAQQAEIDYASEEREFLETQAYNEQVLESIADLNRQYMIGEQNIDVQHIVGTYGLLMNQNEFAANLYDSYMGAIGQIFSNEEMSPAQTAEAVRALVDAMEGSLRMMSEINGIDFGDLVGGVPGADPGTGGMTMMGMSM